MADIEVFEMQNGPYIPAEHEGYDLLPESRELGREVFSYPAELEAVEEILRDAEGPLDDGDGHDVSLLMPYGFSSYAEYFGMLGSYAYKHREANPEVAEALEWLSGAMMRMNVKEDWSIVRYVGHEYDAPDAYGLTRGRCYYWPCSKERPVYEGVIDDDEFTSYLYPCDPGSWEIVLDPTGMAERALAGDADTLSSWYPELAMEEGSLEAWAHEHGTTAKRARGTAAYMEGVDGGWSESESDAVEFPCPGCGETIHHDAWTLVNARRTPALSKRLQEGTLFEFTCPTCGYSASLASPCLYLDPAHHACAYLVADDRMASGVEDMFDNLAASEGPTGGSDVIRRIVRDRHDLRGRAICFENGLDDRVVEILKMALVGMAKQQGAVPMGDDTSVVNLVGMQGADLVFELEHGDDVMSAAMPRGGYELYADAIAHSSIAGEQPYIVDRSWARYAIDVLDDEHVL